jgi:GNAT superfamily N-acetyltransferase
VNQELRPYRDGDEEQVLSLLSSSLGWMPDDQHARFFRWKHLQNPAGRRRCGWTRAGEIIGFRALMRWRFLIDGEPVKAVRAVDTATHPSARGEGVFRDLTMHALDELRAEGVGFVFNTPNDQSRPGYLKVGWIELGRPRGRFRPGHTKHCSHAQKPGTS